VAKHIKKEINTSNTVGSNQNPVTYLHNILQQPLPLHEFKHVSPKEIENVAKSLKAKNSHGYDEIPTKVIKQSISYISSPLAHICNLMLSSGTFPTRLKFAEIKPVYGTCGYGEGLSGPINAGNFLTSCKVYWLASQEGLCSME